MARGLCEGACTAFLVEHMMLAGPDVLNGVLNKVVQEGIPSGVADPVRLCRDNFARKRSRTP